MLLRNREFPYRGLSQAGMICLAVGLVLPWIVRPSAAVGQDALDALRGFLIGVSIPLNLFSLRSWRRGGGTRA
jgi:hypothetical protein